MDTKKIAIMSGKGGSGKTSICVTLSIILSSLNKKVLLVDGDTGTGGMTYYLGLNFVEDRSIGLVNGFKNSEFQLDKLIQKLKNQNNITFLGLGDPKLFNKNTEKQTIKVEKYKKRQNSNSIFHRFFKFLKGDDYLDNLFNISKTIKKVYESKKVEADYVIIDCRGGIDDETLQIARIVDDIIFVIEPDTTSFQATKYSADVLSQNGFQEKIKGFIINKAFDNPEKISKEGEKVFLGSYLGAIPFDMEAMKSFLVGEVPRIQSYYYNHIWQAFSKIYPEDIPSKYGLTINHKEFSNSVNYYPNAQLGNVIMSFVLLIAIIIFEIQFQLNIRIEFFSKINLLKYIIYLIAIISTSSFLKDRIGYYIRKLIKKIVIPAANTRS